MINALPLYVMADASDVGAECDTPHHDGHYRASRLLIYDRHPGGVGIARQAAGLFRELLGAALELVEGCGCGCSGGGGGGSADATATCGACEETDRTGCPGCVHYLACDQYNAVLDKKAAVIVLKATIAAEERAFGDS